MTYGNGTAVAEVEVDIKTAAVKVTRIVFVHDAGKLINPMLAEGQVVGGIAHGIGNALVRVDGLRRTRPTADDHAGRLSSGDNFGNARP